jgi:hypothetical protein
MYSAQRMPSITGANFWSQWTLVWQGLPENWAWPLLAPVLVANLESWQFRPEVIGQVHNTMPALRLSGELQKGGKCQWLGEVIKFGTQFNEKF